MERRERSMAAFSAAELTRALELLSNEIGFERLKDRLVRARAFTSKRGLGSVQSLADRLYMLSGGLRREGTASHGFQSVWGEVFLSRIGEEEERALGEVADRINACLTAEHTVDPAKAATLDRELEAYRGILVPRLGNEAARLDMLMKAVAAVAERIRSRPADAPAERAGS
jgi:hypothetical protein